MPALTRRCSKDDPHRETWLIYFGDIQVGLIGRRAGVPNSAPQWGWSCGFYPGTDPGEHRSGIAETFEEARAGFQAAWQELAATRTEAHYEAWRCQRDWTAWKDRMHDLALPMPTQRPEGIARCFCGEVITSPTLDAHIRATHRTIAA
ncbi:hypothetical protein [Bradyrhizobium japonicum]|uniref:hypothetical protein n=1 Tax=Bradyrhizobium japonicum TaxID=375 RepID=UPI0020A1877D|nr:hypothetical protein [Bradyrhizobium japonicum]MCP1761929.1 hypothetical protein [Bradyrhizobium japonicum]MCP1793509.1 hypothetical protein [Bradyrhizobium japonicum]MCP1805942.1 hypothetical protein [Bradyrhizobium japonicum]MCP1812345.1 hypothetical protein [Bradyrhizobium japonicum]MCP1873612.1 hypothetical protein [Bradyrhizobium japonicum]